jgi:transposase
MFFVGIDLSDKDFCAYMTDASGNRVSAKSFDFNDGGFYSFIDWLRKHEISSDKCMIGLENPRSRMVDFLNQRQYTVIAVNPNATAKYRESRFLSGAKTDPEDAHLIADYIREHEKALRPITIPEEGIRELRILLEDRDRLVSQKVSFSNQLTQTLKDYFPQALDAFGSIDNKCALKFLERYDSFQQVKALSTQEIEQLLKDCHCYHEKSKATFRKAMKQRISHISPEMITAKIVLKNSLVSHLTLIIQHIEQYDKLIKELMSEIPNGDIFTSLPGADYLLGAKLLVLYAGRDFSNANEAQAFYGTAPYTASSGNYHSVRFRIGCHKFGRNTFQQLACCSVKTSQWARKHYYRKKNNEGKGGNHALRCLANLWVKVTFAMWRSKTPYDEAKHMASLAVHIINQPDYVKKA